MNKLFISTALKAGFLAGVLDILAAFIQFYIKTGRNPVAVLKFIASGVFGKEAFTGGNSMILWGLIFHFIIALLFALLFFGIVYQIPVLLKFRWLIAVAYAVFIWSVMQVIVLPLSNTPKLPLTFTNAIIAISILIICMGIPLSFMAGRGKVSKNG